MIDLIKIRHFKCFENLDLPLRQLTLLTGLNAGGKSSVIQALLMLKQSRTAMQAPVRQAVCLNGTDVSLGSVADVIDEQSGRGQFSVGIRSASHEINVLCNAQIKDALTAEIESITETPDGSPTDPVVWPEPSWGVWKTLSHLLHVSTERIGPRETYEADTGAPEVSWRLGPQGEFTAWLLHQRQDEEVARELCQANVPPKLLRQVEAWLGVFFPGAGLEVQRISGTSLVSLRLRTAQAGNFHRPQNVGYGLTHILPILVGALAAEPEGMLIVENPETHLHPSAQALMGEFLARVAASGKQVMIESHSDHILNGIRRSVKSGVLTAEQLQLHFFNHRPRTDADPAHVVSPQINNEGKIDHWPKGFFDQYEQDLDSLTSWD
jgi:predicted ATPase